MKKLLWLLILIPSYSGAVSGYVTNCTLVSISSVTPTELTNNISTNTVTNGPNSVWAVKVANEDTTSDIACSQSVRVSTSGVNAGDIVAHASAPPWNWLSWIINQAKDWYCISGNSSAGSSNAIVCTTQ